ncbi:MAG TPA: c-type cytochrome domain-containing protein, partial [Polyangiaceae bacterium]|nr:c-type cytochrome domain-containing protein [Polyangiaceae bacterium]
CYAGQRMKWLGPVVVVVVAVLAELTLGRASGGPDFALFFGRFHPLIVHLPIGFFLLVAMGEAATFVPKLRDRVEPALGLLVPVSAIAALGAFLMGQLLALEGGFPAGALGWHRRLTLCAVMGMSACWVLYDRQRGKDGQGRWLYRGAMGAALGLLSLGAHFGGTMTRGESYLSKYAPGPLKPLLGAPEAKPEVAKGAEKPAAPSSDPLVYQDVLQPILKQHCVECHGPEKQKGKLRVDSLEELMKGGENGPAIVAGAPKKSSLLTRMLLPETDDDHMPPEGKPGPKAEERALIEFWIERGASPTLKVRDALAPTVSRSLLEHALGGPAPTDSVPVSAGAAAPADTAAPAKEAAAPADTSAAAKEALGADAKVAAKEPASNPATTAEPAATQPVAVAAPSGGGATSGPAFLATHCEKCHGAAKQKGKLRVDSVAAMLKGGSGGPALVPGSPDKSSILKRVRLALSDEEHMPPKKEAQPTAAEVAVLAAWIRSSSGSSAQSSAVAAKTNDSSTSTVVANPTPSADTGVTSGAAPATSAPAAADATTPSAPASDSVATAASSASADVSGPADPAVLQSLPPQVALFTDAVQPLLREKCGKCHIREKPAGGLGVAKHAELLEGGFSGAGIVPKDRKASFVLARLVLPPSDDEHMPPEDEPALNADEIELVGSWIDQGAPAQGLTQTSSLTAGAARALSARGIKGTGTPPAVSAQAGGCAACSVPGAPQSKFLEFQALALVAATALLTTRRLNRRA